MTEKVKLPCGVDDAIKWAREKGYTDCGIVLATQFVPIKFNLEVIARWMVEGDGKNDDKLLNALVNGYEVEPAYKVGDWIVRLDGTTFMNEKAVVQVDKVSDIHLFYARDIGIDKIRIRHATPEEIKAEKERRFWAKIGRKVGEFRIGDIRILDDGNSVRITDVDYARAKYIQGSLKGFFPVETFISFEECDSNA